MWLQDLRTALEKLANIYGSTCCVDHIQANYVTMSNHDVWLIENNGDIRKLEDWE